MGGSRRQAGAFRLKFLRFETETPSTPTSHMYFSLCCSGLAQHLTNDHGAPRGRCGRRRPVHVDPVFAAAALLNGEWRPQRLQCQRLQKGGGRGTPVLQLQKYDNGFGSPSIFVQRRPIKSSRRSKQISKFVRRSFPSQNSLSPPSESSSFTKSKRIVVY